MVSGAKPPAAPMYVAPQPYIAPPAFVTPNLTTPNVATAQQIIQTGNQIEGNGNSSEIPKYLQLNGNNPSLPNSGNPLDPAGLTQYQQSYYQQFGNPAVASAESAVGSNGQGYGSYGGALVAQTKAAQDQAAYNAGLAYAQQNYNNILQGRSSYYAGGPTVATNQNNAQVAATENMNAQLSGIANQQNAYNVGTTASRNAYNANTTQGLQNYGQQNYANQYQNYQTQVQNAQNTALGIGTLGLGLLGGGFGGGGGIGSIFGGGAKQSAAPASVPNYFGQAYANPTASSATLTNGSGGIPQLGIR